ncbi:MAG: radical SAM protein, partial [Gemmatimonadota bacterium]
AYCIPTPLPDELVAAMHRAGCVGVLIGGDSGDEGMLRRLGRDFTAADIQAAVTTCRRHGITTYCTLLLAGPGESEQTVRRSIGLMKQVEPDLVGLALGVRVYPNTALAREVAGETASLYGPGATGSDLVLPTFYFAPALGEELFPLVRELTQGDPRFLFMDPARVEAKASYLQLVTQGLQRGSRGAHWDIVRRAVLGLPPA